MLATQPGLNELFALIDVNSMSPNPPRILVVDDGQDAADSLCMVLRMFGADSSVVYDGPSALDAIRDTRPSVVLLDLTMPGMDGYEVAERVRLNADFNDVQLIALTGWGTEEEKRRSEAAGFTDHWVKPVPADTLKKLIAREIEKSST